MVPLGIEGLEAELLPEVRVERVEKDDLPAAVRPPALGASAPAARQPELDPAARAVAGSRIVLGIHEGLHQAGTVAVLRGEVLPEGSRVMERTFVAKLRQCTDLRRQKRTIPTSIRSRRRLLLLSAHPMNTSLGLDLCEAQAKPTAPR